MPNAVTANRSDDGMDVVYAAVRLPAVAAAFEGAIFDVDGVLVDSPHKKAWRESLRVLMQGEWRNLGDRTDWSPDGFTSELYREEVSGKARQDGARAVLEHFGGPDVEERASTYGERKQAMVVELIGAGDFTVYPDAVRFLERVKDAGLRIAAASSSENAPLLLRKIDVGGGRSLHDLFDADVSGRGFAHGKPHPEMFLAAAHELGVEPGRAIVTEDARAGVEAGKAGGMAVIGVARADDEELLADADLVVTSLDDVDVDALRSGKIRGR